MDKRVLIIVSLFFVFSNISGSVFDLRSDTAKAFRSFIKQILGSKTYSAETLERTFDVETKLYEFIQASYSHQLSFEEELQVQGFERKQRFAIFMALLNQLEKLNSAKPKHYCKCVSRAINGIPVLREKLSTREDSNIRGEINFAHAQLLRTTAPLYTHNFDRNFNHKLYLRSYIYYETQLIIRCAHFSVHDDCIKIFSNLLLKPGAETLRKNPLSLGQSRDQGYFKDIINTLLKSAQFKKKNDWKSNYQVFLSVRIIECFSVISYFLHEIVLKSQSSSATSLEISEAYFSVFLAMKQAEFLLKIEEVFLSKYIIGGYNTFYFIRRYFSNQYLQMESAIKTLNMKQKFVHPLSLENWNYGAFSIIASFQDTQTMLSIPSVSFAEAAKMLKKIIRNDVKMDIKLTASLKEKMGKLILRLVEYTKRRAVSENFFIDYMNDFDEAKERKMQRQDLIISEHEHHLFNVVFGPLLSPIIFLYRICRNFRYVISSLFLHFSIRNHILNRLILGEIQMNNKMEGLLKSVTESLYTYIESYYAIYDDIMSAFDLAVNHKERLVPYKYQRSLRAIWMDIWQYHLENIKWIQEDSDNPEINEHGIYFYSQDNLEHKLDILLDDLSKALGKFGKIGNTFYSIAELYILLGTGIQRYEILQRRMLEQYEDYTSSQLLVILQDYERANNTLDNTANQFEKYSIGAVLIFLNNLTSPQ